MLEFKFTSIRLRHSYGSYLTGALDNFTLGDYHSLTLKYLRYKTVEISNSIIVSPTEKKYS